MITRIDYEGFEAFRLSNETVELVVVPEIGGKIVSLKHVRGREWLWRNPHLPQRRPKYGESFVELHDTGGWDECFPTTNPCKVNGVELPDHGELVTQAWNIEQTSATSIRLSVGGVAMPYRFERNVAIHENGIVAFEYQLENLSSEPLPFTWCCHPLFAIESGISVHLPREPAARISYSATEEYQAGTEFTWPNIDGKNLQALPRSEPTGLKIFCGLSIEAWATLQRADESFMFWFDLDPISHVALWINSGAWSGCGSDPYFNLGFEPCIGPFDSLDEALQVSQEVPCLSAFETRNWALHATLTHRH